MLEKCNKVISQLLALLFRSQGLFYSSRDGFFFFGIRMSCCRHVTFCPEWLWSLAGLLSCRRFFRGGVETGCRLFGFCGPIIGREDEPCPAGQGGKHKETDSCSQPGIIFFYGNRGIRFLVVWIDCHCDLKKRYAVNNSSAVG